MNIVFDYNVDLISEYRSALSPILPKGLAPLLLDPIAGLRGTPDRELSIRILSKAAPKLQKW